MTQLLRFPTAALLGPLAVAVAIALGGWLGEVRVPLAVQWVAFALIGAQVGLRFTRASVASIARMLPVVLLLILAMIAATAATGALLAWATPVDGLTAYLATTPGGLNQLSWLGLELAAGACSSPSDLPWVSVDPTSGTTAPAATSTVDVTFDSTGLTAGLYEGFLCINSNDPDEDPVEVPVSLTVEDDSMPFFGDFEEGDFSEWSFVLP